MLPTPWGGRSSYAGWDWAMSLPCCRVYIEELAVRVHVAQRIVAGDISSYALQQDAGRRHYYYTATDPRRTLMKIESRR